MIKEKEKGVKKSSQSFVQDCDDDDDDDDRKRRIHQVMKSESI